MQSLLLTWLNIFLLFDISLILISGIFIPLFLFIELFTKKFGFILFKYSTLFILVSISLILKKLTLIFISFLFFSMEFNSFFLQLLIFSLLFNIIFDILFLSQIFSFCSIIFLLLGGISSLILFFGLNNFEGSFANSFCINSEGNWIKSFSILFNIKIKIIPNYNFDLINFFNLFFNL